MLNLSTPGYVYVSLNTPTKCTIIVDHVALRVAINITFNNMDLNRYKSENL